MHYEGVCAVSPRFPSGRHAENCKCTSKDDGTEPPEPKLPPTMNGKPISPALVLQRRAGQQGDEVEHALPLRPNASGEAPLLGEMKISLPIPDRYEISPPPRSRRD
jgi:hypothetical protein